MNTTLPEDLTALTDYELVKLIRADWKNIWFGAIPYLDALEEIASSEDGINSAYYADPPGEIAIYFLANAATWKGETARAVKAEMKRRLK